MIEYGYFIAPQPGFHLTVRTPEGKIQQLTVMAKVIPGQREITADDAFYWWRTHNDREDLDQFYGRDDQSQFFTIEHKVLFWKFPSFMVDPEYLDEQIDKARKFDYIVLDLRGNPGGRIDVVDSLTGSFFEHDVKMMDRQGRKKLKPEIAKGKGSKAIHGKLIVLIDGESASGAEIFARVIQLQKRGVVLGDRSSGQVMEAEHIVHAVSLDPWNVSQYWTSVTIANLIMSDGKSLEGVGVTPDERILPTAEDLAAGRDPVLVRAAALAGVQMSPEKAGKIFTFKWPEPPHAMK